MTTTKPKRKKRRAKRQKHVVPFDRKAQRFACINDAARYAARSRGQIYIWATRYPGLLKKDGKTSLVDLARLDDILDSLPVAEINLPPHTTAA